MVEYSLRASEIARTSRRQGESGGIERGFAGDRGGRVRGWGGADVLTADEGANHYANKQKASTMAARSTNDGQHVDAFLS